ncbi:3-hydroxyacyl-CoA dehydrogenase [Enterovirga rhinocerotis]|uniref:3-hydroxyacyl-CoA dehydrogenase n=1 Tax=Enterovirga rhinocerotis TaxID=1339210 RepID=A0A4V3DYU1_9HYPH|nr:3-hydroxyacyl-CoA dehydrogenase [Enterovirga rhinocerotis]TDR93949.1 3-hydroxyacyl-CoA dehydrogenase [Enterovirga rhinocerotis]
MSTVAIVGAGLIGRAWAQVFARAGWTVRITDPHAPTLEAAPRLIREGLDDQASHGLVADPAGAAARVSVAGSIAEAAEGVDLVQENGPETVEAKRAIFAELDRVAPKEAILASSTSAIVASLFTEDLPGRARCLVAHPVNPPHLVPIVELCGAPWTSEDAIARARAIYAAVDQVPITVHREVEGFVLNRLQGALLAEAFRLVGEGVVSPQDLDKTISDGLGLRWSFLGPFATIELNAPGGIPDYCARYTGFYKRLADAPAGASVYGEENVGRIVEAWGGTPSPADLATLSARRDRRLAALAAHKKRQKSEEA